jgi:hypothetical protein
MDRNRYKADYKDKYEVYFKLLHNKMREYKVEEENVYNMDEKGSLMGITGRSKRVFSRQFWEQKRVSAALQDGSREWITILACVCADGQALPPALIFQGISSLQSGWLEDVGPGKHKAFFSNTPSGWSNNDLGLAWLEQVFVRATLTEARQRWRLLILDGHASHPWILLGFATYIRFSWPCSLLMQLIHFSRLMWCCSLLSQLCTLHNSSSTFTTPKA